MMFIDGENLAIRYKSELGASPKMSHVLHIADVAVWSRFANLDTFPTCQIVRRHYYTSSKGDSLKIEETVDSLIDFGIHHPAVFSKPKNGRSKQVDISLATDMLGHAHKKNYDVAILVTGDEDYVPLVQAVKSEGCIVVLWALKSGLSTALRRSVDYVFDIGFILFHERSFSILKS